MRIDHTITSGTFTLDGETHQVDNNVWVIGDDSECLIIDAPHSVEEILKVVGDRRVLGIVCTHAHDDHVRVVHELADRVEAPILVHPDDRPLWELTHPGAGWDRDLRDGEKLVVAGEEVRVIQTPGHSPGGVCLYLPADGVLFSGDTLFNGGPGATGRSYSDRGVIESSIREKLFTLPEDTVVHTGHGDSTTVGAEKAALG
ncbi:MBL fold metallo-hydrolase [Enemella dayhoffiae]|uniref:MBL fold metallo-hydrolase n=1 Tax=Enemella dayhoffiae TaxID=2016507 RepID=A0A255HAW4_9ACTN|nr:MBL fold metallo-hydrolase [Enemella dayhoffiae]OYO24622.1 MBL fold metallo-hydrolase [Enemella dayhoffiae]